jgi:DNA polymerase V
MYALADCNNFFVSCERVFRPDLEGRPVVVLSGNDGCVVSRSNEAKELGIPMGAPLYQIKQLVDKEGVVCFSSNFSLYGDLSDRVMAIIRRHTSRFEQYSIDECFFNIDHIPADRQKAYCEDLVRYIRQGVGIPVSIGIASSKTLAKVASKYAKKYPGYHGVCEIRTEEQRIKALSTFEIGDVWGIGRRAKAKLTSAGITNALQFTDKPASFAKGLLHKPGLLTWQELRGQDVIDITQLPMKQSVTTSRTFATAITEQTLLEEQIANFCAHCARQLRTRKSLAQQLFVYAHTSAFRTDIAQHYLSEWVTLPVPTSNSQELISYALAAFRRAFRPGTLYKKAGVVLTKIIPETAFVPDLFDEKDRDKDKRLQRVLDHIDDRHGKRAIILGSQMTSATPVYKTDHKSPLYTTDLRDILTVIAK